MKVEFVRGRFVLLAMLTSSACTDGGSAGSVVEPGWRFVDGDSAGGINYDTTREAEEPQLAEFAGSLYATWEESDGTVTRIRVKTHDGIAWTPAEGGAPNGINYDAARAAAAPQLAVFGSKLYATWHEANSAGSSIRVKSYDGASWTWNDGATADGINKDPTKAASNPQLTPFGQYLFATWQEPDASGISQIRVRRYDGSSWTWVDGGGASGVNHDSRAPGAHPQLTVLNGELYAIWQERAGTDQVRVRKYDGSSWAWVDGDGATGINFGSANNGDRPQLTVYGGALYATWREGSASARYQVRVRRYAAGNWEWVDGGGPTGMNYQTAADSHEPQLTALGDSLFATWFEASTAGLQVRVKKYDGSGWTWFDGGGAAGLNWDPSQDALHPQLTVFGEQLYATWWERTSAPSQSEIRVCAYVR